VAEKKEGAAYVEQVNAAQQKQKEDAIASQQARKNAELQNQLTIGETNRVNGQNLLFNAKFADDVSQGHLDVQKTQQEVAANTQAATDKAQENWDSRGILAKGYDVDPTSGQVKRTGQTPAGTGAAATTAAAPAGTPNAIPGVTPAAPTGTGTAATTAVPAPAGTPNVLPGVTPAASASPAVATTPVPRDGQYFLRQQALFEASKQAIVAANGGKSTPVLDAAQKVFDDPNSNIGQIQRAGILAQNAAGLSDATVKRLKDIADSQTAQTTARFAVSKAQADIALAKSRATAAAGSQAKTAFELGQETREAADLATPDAVGFSSKLGPREYDKRYDAFTKSKDYQTLSTLKGSYQQFQDTLNHIATTGEMTGAESVVGLFNAIGISATPLAGKGFRINSNTVEEHQEARGIDQAAYQKLLKLKNGDVITPKQLSDYSNIAAGVYHNSYVNAADEAHRQGLPVDFLPQGGGRAPDPITARIYTDVVLHTNPELGNNPAALKDAIKKAAGLNGWKVE
jgi:hypothetical protein